MVESLVELWELYKVVVSVEKLVVYLVVKKGILAVVSMVET